MRTSTLRGLLLGAFALAALPACPPARLPASLLAQAPKPATTTPPLPGPAPDLVMPVVERGSLGNGLQVQVVEMHEVPLVQATLFVDGGARLDGGMPGQATFTANMLDEGAGDRDAFQLAAELEYLGASLSTTADWNFTRLSLRAPKRTFPQAMQLLGDVVLRPRFTAVDIQRQRDLRQAAIVARRDRPQQVAQLVFGSAVFPSGHPYHQPIDGDSAATAKLDSAGVRSFWERSALPSRATLVVTGDVTLTEARQWANDALGTWRNPAVAPAPLLESGPQPARPATHVVLVDKPGAPQSVVAIGAPGYDRRSPDYPAITLMNAILGGSFSARLNDILREQKGYTYGAFSIYDWQPIPSAFVASTQVRTNVTDSSLAVMFQEFKRIRDEPVSQAELDRAKQYLVLGALTEFETTGQVSGVLSSLMPWRLPLQTVPDDLAAIQRLGAAEVQQAAVKYLDPARMTVVVVGDVKAIRPGLEALGLGPTALRDADGRVIGGTE